MGTNERLLRHLPAGFDEQRAWRLLVIDGDALLRRSRMRALAAEGAEVMGVAHGEEALRLCESMVFDAVVCDQRLGEGLDGASVLAALAARYPAMRRVLIASYSPPYHAAHAVVSGTGNTDDLCLAILGLHN